MKITFLRSTMKRALDICIRMAEDKKKAMVWISTSGEDIISLYTNRDDKKFKYFHELYAVEKLNRHASFLVDPVKLVELFKPRSKEQILTFEIKEKDDESFLYIENDKIIITPFEGTFPINKFSYNEVDTEQFKTFIDLAVNSTGRTIDTISFGGREISVRSPLYLKRINLDENINAHTFPAEYIRLISRNMIWRKTDQKQILTFDKNDELYIKLVANNKKREVSSVQVFALTDFKETIPNVKNLDSEVVHSFEVNAEHLLGLISKYPAKVRDLYLYDKDGDLIIDPYNKRENELDEDQDQPIHAIEYKGNVKRTKISTESLKALLTGYEENVTIDIERYEEDDRIYYALRILTPLLYSISLTINEPNYEKMQKELDKIIEEQNKLTYI